MARCFSGMSESKNQAVGLDTPLLKGPCSLEFIPGPNSRYMGNPLQPQVYTRYAHDPLGFRACPITERSRPSPIAGLFFSNIVL